MFLKPLIVPLLWIVLVLVIFFSGDFHGRGVIQSRWNQAKANEAAVLKAAQEQWTKSEQRYAAQIAQALSERDHNRALLARIRRDPLPRLLCRTEGGTSPMSGVPGTSGGGSAPGGALPPTDEFDPSERLFAQVADAADNAVEACREALAKWPKESNGH